MKLIASVFVALLIAVSAQAQTVIKPNTATFTYPDVDLAEVTGFHFDVFSCATMTAGVCVPVTTPSGTGVDVPNASVSGPASARTFSLSAASIQTFIATLPTTTAYIATLIGNGDPAQGFGPTARSAASNPFFLALKTPAVPGVPHLQ